MSKTSLATVDGRTATLDRATLETFERTVEGALLRPGDDGFAEATRLWNGMIDKTPALVLQPQGPDDVAAALELVREHDLLLSVRGGGHNIAGTALVDGGLTLDMSRMRGVEVDPEARTVRVGPGCLLGDVDDVTQEHGLATVLGFVSETGVAGLTLGGGFGYLTRRFGWTVDNLLEVEVVTADGQVRRASRDEHPDLFWGLRGAGQNLGVVTEFVFRLHEVGPEVTGGLMGFPAETAEQASQVLEAYRALTQVAPRELTLFVILRKAPPAPFVPEAWHGRRVAIFVVCHTGLLDQAPRDLAPLTEALGEPVFDIVETRRYAKLQSLIDATQPKGNHYYWKSEYAKGLDDDLLTTLADQSLENPVPGGQLTLAHLGGALNERAADDGVVGNRDARYIAVAQAMWEPTADDDPPIAWVRQAWRAFRPFSTGAGYVNFQTADEDEGRVHAAYGENLGRLRKVKATYDPDNRFRSNQNILTGGPDRR